MTARRLCARVAQLAVAGALALSVAACTCPPPDEVDQTFVLGDTVGTPLDLVDAGLGPARDAGADAVSNDASNDAAMSSFRGAPGRDCTSAAAGCAPGGACAAACTCVLTRAGVYDGTIQRCTLLVGSGPPQVRVRYAVPVFCGD
ncbi:MAG TPA: hypothetical protein VK989_12465 [Polyangia bacterium]|jgi:hypothetical protein|nr:hypothetical protein [Polyangia bacterium]